MENRVFNDNADLDRIEVIATEDISMPSEDLSSAGCENCLTGKYLNNNHPVQNENVNEFIEMSPIDFEPRKRTSVFASSNSDIARAPTPINMVRRWSQSISHFSKDKRSIRKKSIGRLPSRNLYFEIDGEKIINDKEAELRQLFEEIEQYDYLMQNDPLSRKSRLETLRSLPQPLSIKRQLKILLSISEVMQHSNKSKEYPEAILKCLLNFTISFLLKTYKLIRLISNSIEIWYQDLKTIEGHFGRNICSYFKFLRWLFALNLVLFIFPFCFITIPQILYNDDMRRRGSQNSISSSAKLALNNTSFIDKAANLGRTGSVMDFLNGEGVLNSSLLFYGSYSNVSFQYRRSTASYSIPNAYYMTMLVLYLSVFVIISTNVAHSYRKSFIEASNGMRSVGVYASKICFAWDYGITYQKAAELKHFAIYTELKDILIDLNSKKTKMTILYRIWMWCIQSITHLLFFAITACVGVFIWIFLQKQGDTPINHSSLSTLFTATIINITVLLLQKVFSWISCMEGIRSPSHMLYVSMVRNFLLESTIISVLLYYWITKKHIEGWETRFAQEIYRLIVLDCFISLLIKPAISCFRVFFLIRYFPNLGRSEFEYSLISLDLIFNQTLIWIGLFFAPLLAGIMVIKIILLFSVNKAMVTYICGYPRHVWHSAHASTLYLLFSFLSLLGVILTFGYIMTQIPVSQLHGPFRNESYMFHIFIDGILKLRKSRTVWSILMFLMRPYCVAGMLLMMSSMVYYLHEKAHAHCKMVKILKGMIYEEIQDKEFLLSTLTKITMKREAYLESKEKDENDASLTEQLLDEINPNWKYLKKRGVNFQPSSTSALRTAAIIVKNERASDKNVRLYY